MKYESEYSKTKNKKESFEFAKMTKLYVPSDNILYRNIYEAHGGGTCGLACLAVLLRTTIKEMLRQYHDFHGFSDYKEVKRILVAHGYEIKQKGGKKATSLALPQGVVAIVRIQWLGKDNGKFHGYKFWIEANKNTHYIYVEGEYFYCNANGWNKLSELSTYLSAKPKGYITSYLEVREI